MLRHHEIAKRGAAIVVAATSLFLNITAEAAVRYVKRDATGANNGTSWADAYTDLQSALATAVTGDEVWVAAGTYKPTAGTERIATFQLKNGVGVYGGFAGGETQRNERNPMANVTTLSGDLNGNDRSDGRGRGENSFHVVTANDTDTTAVLDGFTIIGGQALPEDGECNGYPECIGAGLFVGNGSPTIRTCVFTRNWGVFGGGIGNQAGNPILLNCTFDEHWSWYGGGLFNSRGNPMLVNCTFAWNFGLFGGSAISSDPYDPAGSGTIVIINCTFAGNSGITLRINGANDAVLTNCIMWDVVEPEIYLDSGGSVTASHSNIRGGWPGTGNIDIYPLVTPNMHLRMHSPCLDAGDPGFVPTPPGMIDIDGEVRVYGGRVDIGPDEFVDAGADHLPDWWELRYFGSATAVDPAEDPDDDGLTNLQEYEEYGTNPVAPPYWVDVLTGDDAYDGLHPVPLGNGVGPKKTIQAALNLAIDGDTILVAPGLYQGTGNFELDFQQKSVVVRKHSPGTATIDCGGTGRAVKLDSIKSTFAVLEGFTIANGKAGDYGGGIRTDQSRLMLKNCVITGSSADASGGALYSDLGTPTIDGLTIEAGNSIPQGVISRSNVHLQGGLYLNAERLDLRSSWFDGPGTIHLADGTLMQLTGTVGDPPVVIRSDVRGLGDIKIPAGLELDIQGGAVVDLSGGAGGNCTNGCVATDPVNWGTITVEGVLAVHDATIRNTNVSVKLADFTGACDIVNNDIRLKEATTGYGGEFFVEGAAHIECNTIRSEGDRYLDLDPDPNIPPADRPLICGNKIYVEIKEGILGSKGTLLELRTPDYDCTDECSSGVVHLASSAGYSDTWVLEELEILDDAKVNLTNRQGFEFNGPDVREVLYVKKVIMHPGTVLNTGLQRMYYQELVDEGGQPINPSQLPDATGRKIVDEPLLGFSLGLIAMDNDTEFSVRIRKRERDSRDVQPPPPAPALEGSMLREANTVTGQGGLLDMRTQAVGKQPASSVAAKGAFARAGKEEILIAFQYLFMENSDAELVIYLSDDPHVGEGSYEVGRLRPPNAHRAGAIESGRFGIWQKRVPWTAAEAHGLNLTGGVYVELELVASRNEWGQPVPSWIWLDNFDPAIICGYTCGDLDTGNDVTELDFLLLLGEMGQPVAEQKRNCLDLSGDGYVDMADVLQWGAHFGTKVNNLCAQKSMAAAKSLRPADSRQSASSSAPHGLIMAGRQKGGGGVFWADTVISLDQDRACLDEFPPAGGLGSVTNGRLVLDGAGVVHQIGGRSTSPSTLATGLYCLNNLDDDNDNVRVLAPHRDTFAHPILGSVYVDVDLVAGQDHTFPLTDAVFSPKLGESNVVYVVPVVVRPASGQAFEPFCAAARLVLNTPRDGGYMLQAVYGLPDAANSDAHNAYPREIEISSDGQYLCIASAYASTVGGVAETENDYLLVYDPSQSGAPVKEIPLWNTSSEPAENPAMLSLPIHGPTSLMVSRHDSSVYCAAALNAQNPASVPTTRLFRFSRSGADLTFVGAADIPHPVPGGYDQPTFTAMMTAITEDRASGKLWVAGYSAPYYDASYLVTDPPFGDNLAPLFTLPTWRSLMPHDVSWSTTEPIEPLEPATTPIECHDLALPYSLVFGSGPPADFDGDGDVDAGDVAAFESCASGPGVPHASGCEGKDLDHDSDVDQSDFAVFQRCYSGENVAVDPNCGR